MILLCWFDPWLKIELEETFYFLIIPVKGATCLFTSGLCLCAFFYILIAEAVQGKSLIGCKDFILTGRSNFKMNYT